MRPLRLAIGAAIAFLAIEFAPADAAGPCPLSTCSAAPGTPISLSFGQGAPPGWASSIMFFANVDTGGLRSRTYTATSGASLTPQGSGNYGFVLPNLCATSPGPWNFVVIGNGPGTQISYTLRVGGPVRAGGTFTPQCASTKTALSVATPTPQPATPAPPVPTPAPKLDASLCGGSSNNPFLLIGCKPADYPIVTHPGLLAPAGSSQTVQQVGSIGSEVPTDVWFWVFGGPKSGQFAGQAHLTRSGSSKYFLFTVPSSVCAKAGTSIAVDVHDLSPGHNIALGRAGYLNPRC
jgi:hypothetical protein